MIKHYVRFYHPDSIGSQTSVRLVYTRKIETLRVPMDAFAFEFFDCEERIENGEKLRGGEKNLSQRTYIGVEQQAREVLSDPTLSKIARLNIELNGWARYVSTSRGQLFPLKDSDVVVLETSIVRARL